VRTCKFGPLVVSYDDRVLRPRPWTLRQSEWAAELAAVAPAGAILELCAGAGQIGLAAAVQADRDLVQIEADPVAAGFARRNAAAAGWSARVDVRVGNLQDALRADESFPVVVADPPYLPTVEVATWPEDPITAIDGGPDGLELITACLAVSARHLQAGGSLLLQVAGPAQAEQVAALLSALPGLRIQDQRVIDPARAVVLIEAAR
jgi:methylase of polypeptide subunit release factors